jgi:hypothetical protein
MRLDAHKGDTFWGVYHAEECRELKCVVWLDDETCEYCCVLFPARCVNGHVVTETFKARKIDIYCDRKFVIINPIEDADDENISDCIGEFSYVAVRVEAV